MTKLSVIRDTPYTADQIYRIVEDVSSYKEFMPLVKGVNTRSTRRMPDGTVESDVEVLISYPKLGIREATLSHVTADPATHTIRTRSNQGIVQSMNGEWTIRPKVGGGSEIQFDIDYTLKSRSLQFLLSGMTDYVVRKILTAFTERARKLYGAPSAAS